MNSFKNLIGILFLILLSCASENENEDAEMPMVDTANNPDEYISSYKTTIQFKSTDSIDITADIYELADTSEQFLLLFHQAGYSRGEYKGTAHTFNDLGFNCMAVDQRSGNEVNGVKNETYVSAKENGTGVGYADAYPDLKAALEYIITQYDPEKLILLGSSYSASLVFILAAEYKDEVDAVIAFSPGEYFTFKEKTIESYASEVHCPVFITSAKDEFNDWKSIYDAVPSEKKSYFLPETKGYHGSQALWSKNEGHEKYWDALKEFLKSTKSKD